MVRIVGKGGSRRWPEAELALSVAASNGVAIPFRLQLGFAYPSYRVVVRDRRVDALHFISKFIDVKLGGFSWSSSLGLESAR